MLMVRSVDSGSVAIRWWERGCLAGTRRCGMVPPSSTSESVVTVELDSPAAALGVVMRRCLTMRKVIVLWVTPLDDFRTESPGRERNDRLRGEKGEKQSQR